MADVVFGKDGSYSAQAIVTKTNADLANSFGNLVQRTLSMIFKNMNGQLERYDRHGDDNALLDVVATACRTDLPREFTAFNFSGGIEAWMRAVFACNQYVDDQAPWTLKKNDPDRMKAVLMTLFCAIHDLTIAIRPVVPSAADAILDQMGIAADARDYAALGNDDWCEHLIASGFSLDQPSGAFPRLEMPMDGEGEAF